MQLQVPQHGDGLALRSGIGAVQVMYVDSIHSYLYAHQMQFIKFALNHQTARISQWSRICLRYQLYVRDPLTVVDWSTT